MKRLGLYDWIRIKWSKDENINHMPFHHQRWKEQSLI